jgi:hypothetical protein
MRMIRSALAMAAALSLSSCAGLGTLMSGAPPAAVQNAAAIARGPIDFALHAFDASLYAFDLAMDLKRPAPGSPEAKRIAALGRRVLAALAVADAAQKAGSSATYEEAFRNANTAFNEFRQVLGVPAGDAARLDLRMRPFTPRDREAILATAERDPAIAAVLGIGG